MIEFKRKLYKRGSSFETTIPIQMLFSQDLDKKHNVIFKLDNESGKWYIEFEETEEIMSEPKRSEHDQKSKISDKPKRKKKK